MLLHKAATFESALADASVAEDKQHLLAAIGESGLVEHKASPVRVCAWQLSELVRRCTAQWRWPVCSARW